MMFPYERRNHFGSNGNISIIRTSLEQMTCTAEKLGVLLQSQMARGVCSVGFYFGCRSVVLERACSWDPVVLGIITDDVDW